MKRIKVAAFILIATGLVGCAGDGSTSGSGNPQIQLQPDVHVLTPDSPMKVASVTPESITITGTTVPRPGMVLVSEEHTFARKVVSVSRDGDQHRCTTTQASITEIFKEAKVSMVYSVKPEDVASMELDPNVTYIPTSKRGTRDPIEMKFEIGSKFPFFDGDDGLTMNLAASVALKLDMQFDFEVEDGELKSFVLAPVTSATLGTQVEYKRKFERTSPKVKWGTLKFKPIPFMVGSVPVVVVPKHQMFADMSCRLQGGAKQKLEATASVKAGFRYQRGHRDEWTMIDERSFTAVADEGPQPYVNAEFSMSLLKADFDFMLYDGAGPSLALDVAKLSAKWEAKSEPEFTVKRSCSIAFSAAGKLKARLLKN